MDDAAGRAGGLLPGDVDEDAGRHHGDDEGRTSVGDERQGMPVTGSTPTTAPILIKVSLANQATSPTASIPPNRWGERIAARMPNQTKEPSSTRTSAAPMKPSSSPMTEKMKSVCALGRNPHWACPPPRPAPMKWPEPRPMRDCTTWYPDPAPWEEGSMKESSRSRRYGEATATTSAMATRAGQNFEDRSETHAGHEQHGQGDDIPAPWPFPSRAAPRSGRRRNP